MDDKLDKITKNFKKASKLDFESFLFTTSDSTNCNFPSCHIDNKQVPEYLLAYAGVLSGDK